MNRILCYHCLNLKVKCSTTTFLTINKIKYSICNHDILSYKMHRSLPTPLPFLFHSLIIFFKSLFVFDPTKHSHLIKPTGLLQQVVQPLCNSGPPRGTRNPAFTQVFRANHAQKLPKIHVHAKFTRSRFDTKLIYHAITQFFPFNSRFHALKYVL